MRASGIVKDEDRDKLFQAYRLLFVEATSPRALATLDENSGVDVQEVGAILQRMKNLAAGQVGRLPGGRTVWPVHQSG